MLTSHLSVNYYFFFANYQLTTVFLAKYQLTVNPIRTVYFEGCDFCAFLGGKTTEHESFSGQRNAGQGKKDLKRRRVSIFRILEKNFFEIYIKFPC